MAFAATGPWSEIGHHSPPSLVEESYKYWIGRIGKDNNDKVVISTPFYGFNFRNDHTEGNKSTAPSMGYNEILGEYPEAYLNDTIKTDSSVIFHNGIKTFGQKIDFVKDHDLKGISIWELSFDMNTKDKSLLKYINSELYKGTN
jgi:spore germination protein YaaH